MAESQKMRERIENDFAWHSPPTPHDGATCEQIRRQFRALAHFIADVTPESRDQSVALTHLEEAQRAAIASVAKTWPLKSQIDDGQVHAEPVGPFPF